MKLIYPLMLLGALSAGCCVVESAPALPQMGGDAVEHVVAFNYGWNLFGCIPVVCGNADSDSWCPFAFFRNDVRDELVGAKVLKRAADRGCDVRNFCNFNDRAVFFDCYYAPVPWIIQYREVNCSAVLVRKGAK